MPQIKDVTRQLEQLAPLAYQEGYDNAGLLVGQPGTEVTGILISLDVTEQVVEEAVARGCNLIVAHHPIVFKGLKKLNGANYVERTVISAIRNNIAIYATHTNLDHVQLGVNREIAERLGLNNLKILAPKQELLSKLAFFVPVAHTQVVLDALFARGAGTIGDYEQCSFRTEGTGSFLPTRNAKPVIGALGTLEVVREHRVEVMFPSHLESQILDALKDTHPYEEVAYYLQTLRNENQEVGAGMVGELPDHMEVEDFLAHLKASMQTGVIRHTVPVGPKIRKVAVCGGAGSFLLSNAVRSGADVFITGDYKYHEFFDADGRIMICDIGHYESEVFTKELLYKYLSGIFSNFALCLSEVVTNPVRYYA